MLKQELEQKLLRNSAPVRTHSKQLAFLHDLATACGMAPSVMGWALQHQSTTKTVPCRLGQSSILFSQLSHFETHSFQVTPKFVPNC